MTGKDLKDFAAKVRDESVIEVRLASPYAAFEREFYMRAVLLYQHPTTEKVDPCQ